MDGDETPGSSRWSSTRTVARRADRRVATRRPSWPTCGATGGGWCAASSPGARRPNGRRSHGSSARTSGSTPTTACRSSRSSGRPTSTSTCRRRSTRGCAEAGASTVEVVGMTDYRHRGPFGLADLIAAAAEDGSPRPAAGQRLRTVRRRPGRTARPRECLRAAVVLATDGDDAVALLYRGSDPETTDGVTVEVVAASSRGRRARIATSSATSPGAQRLPRPGRLLRPRRCSASAGRCCASTAARPLDPDALILPAATFADVRRQVVGVARNRDAAALGRPAPQARPAALRPAGRRQDPHRALPGRAS